MSSPRPSSPSALDRQTTTPFHLKLFYHSHSFQPLSAFPIPTPSDPSSPLPNHLQIYTWPTCTLLELSQLLTSTLPTLLPSPAIGTRLAFRLVFPDTRPPPLAAGGRLRGDDDAGRGRYTTKEMGSVVVAAATQGDAVNGEAVAFTESAEASRTLASFRFVIGDFVDVAILPEGSGGGAAGMGVGSSRNYTARGGRENGHAGYGGYGGQGYGRGRGGYGSGGRLDDYGDRVPPGEWRRGERLPDASGGGRGYYGGPRGRDRGY